MACPIFKCTRRCYVAVSRFQVRYLFGVYFHWPTPRIIDVDDSTLFRLITRTLFATSFSFNESGWQKVNIFKGDECVKVVPATVCDWEDFGPFADDLGIGGPDAVLVFT